MNKITLEEVQTAKKRIEDIDYRQQYETVLRQIINREDIKYLIDFLSKLEKEYTKDIPALLRKD